MARLKPGILFRPEARMAVIYAFVAVVIVIGALNWYEFGRPD